MTLKALTSSWKQHFPFFLSLTDIKNTAASWPLQALMAEVMSEAAKKSVIAMIVEKRRRTRLSGVICAGWRAETIYWWQRKDTQHHHPVCQKPPVSFCLLSPTADHSSTLNAGKNRRTRNVHVCVSPSQRSNWEWHAVSLDRLWPGSFVLWTKAAWSWGCIWMDLQGHWLAYTSSLLLRPVTLAASSPVQAVNILLLSLFRL